MFSRRVLLPAGQSDGIEPWPLTPVTATHSSFSGTCQVSHEHTTTFPLTHQDPNLLSPPSHRLHASLQHVQSHFTSATMHELSHLTSPPSSCQVQHKTSHLSPSHLRNRASNSPNPKHQASIKPSVLHFPNPPSALRSAFPETNQSRPIDNKPQLWERKKRIKHRPGNDA